jgi:hypothetical protein
MNNALFLMLYSEVKQCSCVMVLCSIVGARDLLRRCEKNVKSRTHGETLAGIRMNNESEEKTTKEGREALHADTRPQVFGQPLLWPCRWSTIPHTV